MTRSWTTVLCGVCLAAIAPPSVGGALDGVYLEVRQQCPATTVLTAAKRAAPVHDFALLAWRIGNGSHGGTALDGMAIVALVTPRDANGDTAASTRSVLWVDSRATPSQRDALIDLVKKLAPDALGEIQSVSQVKIDLRIGEGCGAGYAVLEAGNLEMRTRRMADEDSNHAKRLPADRAPLAACHALHDSVVSEWSCAASPAGQELPRVDADALTATVGRFGD
jgi:hypothetical protein